MDVKELSIFPQPLSHLGMSLLHPSPTHTITTANGAQTLGTQILLFIFPPVILEALNCAIFFRKCYLPIFLYSLSGIGDTWQEKARNWRHKGKVMK